MAHAAGTGTGLRSPVAIRRVTTSVCCNAGQAVAEAVGHDQGHGECGRGSDGEPDAGIADPARCVPGEHHHQVATLATSTCVENR